MSTSDGWNKAWEGLRWLTLVGTADEAAVRARLLLLADRALATVPETGIHAGLPTRAAVLLLWLTQDPANEKRAGAMQSGWEDNLRYDERYLNDVEASPMRLERRHVQAVLDNANLSVTRRLARIDDFVSEPSVSFPVAVVQYIADYFSRAKFNDMDLGQEITTEERIFDELKPSGARMAKSELVAACLRRVDESLGRTGASKYWVALRSLHALLVLDDARGRALANFRANTSLPVLPDEQISNSWILQLELLHLPLEQQLDTLVSVQEYVQSGELYQVLRSPDGAALTEFLSRHSGSALAERVALEAMAHWEIDEPVGSDGRLLAHLASANADTRRAAFGALIHSQPLEMGQFLEQQAWSPDYRDSVVAHYGSQALVEATKAKPFADLLLRIAPWRLFDAVLARGADPQEMMLAIKHVLSRIARGAADEPDINADVVFRPRAGAKLGRIAVEERPDADADDLAAALRKASSSRAVERHAFGVEMGDAIEYLRTTDFSMFLQAFAVDGVRAAWQLAPTEMRQLLQGVEEPTEQFLGGLRSAEGLYVALCEVLLESDEDLGAKLWRTLRSRLRTRFLGEGEVHELTHILFRAGDSMFLRALREELLTLRATHTDEGLLDIVIAVQFHARDAWLNEFIARDKASGVLWRSKRAIVLEALASRPDVASLRWPEGEKVTSWEGLSSRMNLWANNGSLAQYWWNQFVAASTAEDAFAAWELLLHIADRRILPKVNAFALAKAASELDRLKVLHVQAHVDGLEQAARRREEENPKFAEKLFGSDSPNEWLLLDGRKFS